jgi:hypothetical protein
MTRMFSGNLPTGWFVTAGTRLGIGKLRKDWFGVAGELTANYKKVSPLGFAISFRSYSLMGGPRLTARQWKRLRPSAHTLAGIVIEKTSSDELDIHGSTKHFAFAPGGFVDAIITARFAIRAGVNERFVVAGNDISNEWQLLSGGVISWR